MFVKYMYNDNVPDKGGQMSLFHHLITETIFKGTTGPVTVKSKVFTIESQCLQEAVKRLAKMTT